MKKSVLTFLFMILFVVCTAFAQAPADEVTAPVLSDPDAYIDLLLHPAAGQPRAAFAYENDPQNNPKAMKDIVVNPDAVFGFSPSPESVRYLFRVTDHMQS